MNTKILQLILENLVFLSFKIGKCKCKKIIKFFFYLSQKVLLKFLLKNLIQFTKVFNKNQIEI
jgi:hypothetical protein